MKKIFVYKPLSMMTEGESGYVPVNALAVVYNDQGFSYSLNLQSSYSSKKEGYNRVPVFKKDNAIFLGNVLESGLIFPSATALPLDWLEYTELTPFQPVYYRSVEYLQEASYPILCVEFDEILTDPGQIQKNPQYFESLIGCLCNKDTIRNHCSTLCLLDLMLLYFSTQDTLAEIENETPDSWTEKEISVYQSSLDVIFELVGQKIPQEWSSLSKERQIEFKDLFKEQEHWEWLKFIK